MFDFLADMETPFDSDQGDQDGDQLETSRTLDRPVTYARKLAKREYINGLKKEALNLLIPELPPPDVELIILTNGSGGTYRQHEAAANCFEFGHFISVICDRLGYGCHLYASTWTMNRQHGENILNMLDDGRLKSVVLFTDTYWKRRESAVANTVITGLIDRGQRYLSFKNHVKAIAIANADHTRFCTALSSCNFSSQPRAENITLNTDPGCFEFLKQSFFEAMITNAKSNQN